MSNAIRVLAVACLAALFCLGGRTSAQAPERLSAAPDEQEALRSAKASLVRVSLIVQTYEGIDLAGWGSGFVVAPGYVVTNYHVVSEAYAGRAILMVTPAASTEGEPVAGRVIRTWPHADLALVRVEGLTAPPLTVATGEPDQTKAVRALGYPAATCMMVGCTGRDIVEPAQPDSTEGAISGFQNRAPNGAALPTIFHTAAISSGNSGGPLIDRCGRVLGVNTWTAGGQVDAQGHVNLPGGQNVASRASTLEQFLREAGVAFSSQAEPCMTAADVKVIEDQRRLDEAEAALRKLEAERQAQAAAAAAAEAKARADQRLWIIIGCALALLAAAGGGLYLLSRRNGGQPPAARHGDPGTVATTRPSSLEDAPPPSNLPLLAGVAALAVVGGGGLAWLLLAAKPAPAVVEPAPQPTTGLLRLDCTPDAAASFGAEPPKAVSFLFDTARQCVNSRTAYASAGDSYERYIVHRDSATVTRNRISKDLRSFTQEEFAIPRQQWRAWTAAMKSPPECAVTETGVAGVEARLGATASLRQQLPSMPVGKAVRRCVSAR